MPQQVSRFTTILTTFKKMFPQVIGKDLCVQVPIIPRTVRNQMAKPTVPVRPRCVRNVQLLVQTGKDARRGVDGILGDGVHDARVATKQRLIQQGVQNLILSFNGRQLVSGVSQLLHHGIGNGSRMVLVADSHLG